MYIIPVLSATLDLLQELNNGVRPVCESKLTYFVFKPDAPAQIISDERLKSMSADCAIVALMYFP